VTLIFLNLFIAIILDGFQETQKKEQRVINGDTLNSFKSVWAEFDPEGTGFIRMKDLKEFLSALGPPLGFDVIVKDDKNLQNKLITALDLPIYNSFQDYVFLDVLEALVHQATVR